jgi:hypothetical protein
MSIVPHEEKSTAAPFALLAELEDAHEQLRAALIALEHATRARSAEESQYADARWKLNRANRNRRAVVTRICDQLVPRASKEDAEALKAHQAEDFRALRDTAAHVGTWTPQTIAADWSSYCSASRAVQANLLQRLSDERHVLYPILRRYPDAGAAASLP